MGSSEKSLDGRSVLIAEDEAMIAMLMEDVVEQLGGHVVGVVASSSDALRAIANGPISVIVLDVHLNGGTSEAILAAADSNGIPVLVSSGSDPSNLPAIFRNRPVLPKPWTMEEAHMALVAAVSTTPSTQADELSTRA